MSATAYLLVVIDTEVCAFVGVDIFSEPEPTLGPRRACGILTEVGAITYDAAHRSLVREVATFHAWAWTLPHLGRCRSEVEAVRAEREEDGAGPAPALTTCPPLVSPVPPVAVRAATPANGSYQLVVLAVSKFRIAAYVTPHPVGFVFEEVRADGTHGEAHYVGASAIAQMWPCEKVVALATAAKLGFKGLDLPPWAVVPPPPKPPPPPIPVLQKGDRVHFDHWDGGCAVVRAVFEGTLFLVTKPWSQDDLVLDTADPGLPARLRCITRNGENLWEREPGLFESETISF